jgi:acyl-CoA dehydrogenase
VRAFVDTQLIPFVDEWDERGDFPKDLPARAAAAGVYAPMWPRALGGTPPAAVDGFAPDAFHDLIFHDELARCASGGLLAAFMSFGIALPPLLAVGSDYLKAKVARRVITGKTLMALAITEPNAGSDVAAITTTATRVSGPCDWRSGDDTPGIGGGDEAHWLVNGAKKFITSGTKSQFFTVAVRTCGGSGHRGITLLLLERGMPGLTTRRMKTQGW